MRLKRVCVFSIGFRSKCSGMIGRLAKLHLPRFLSSSPGEAELDEVTDGRRDDPLVVLKDVVVFWHLPKRAGEIGGDAGLFCNNKSFRHGIL